MWPESTTRARFLDFRFETARLSLSRYGWHLQQSLLPEYRACHPFYLRPLTGFWQAWVCLDQSVVFLSLSFFAAAQDLFPSFGVFWKPTLLQVSFLLNPSHSLLALLLHSLGFAQRDSPCCRFCSPHSFCAVGLATHSTRSGFGFCQPSL